jgi:SAM-dependent methyltransferase
MTPTARDYYADPEHAAGFEGERFFGKFGRLLLEHDLRLFLGSRGDVIPAGARILDAGAGTGRLTLPLCQRVPPLSVTALDFSEAMLDQLRAKCANLPNPPQIIHADITQTGLPSRAFHAVLSARVLMHLPDWRAGLAELCRLSADFLLFDFPPAPSLGAWLAKMPALQKEERHAYLRLPHIKAELARHGFAPVAIRKSFVLPIRLHLKLNAPGVSRLVEGGLALLGLRTWLGAPVFVLARRSRMD